MTPIDVGPLSTPALHRARRKAEVVLLAVKRLALTQGNAGLRGMDWSWREDLKMARAAIDEALAEEPA